MSGIGRPKVRPRGSGGKGNGKVPTIPTSVEQRSTTKHTTPRVGTPSPSCSNHGVPLGIVPTPPIPSNSKQMNTSKNAHLGTVPTLSIPSSSKQMNTSKNAPLGTIPTPSSSNPSAHLSTSHVPSPITERSPTPQYPTAPIDTESETVPLTEEDNDHNSQPENFIPFGDPTLPGPHNPHLPWGKDLTDNKIWIYTLKGYLYPDDNETKDISKAIKSMFDGPYNNWKCCNDKIKEIWFNEWAKNYKWIGEQEATIRATWESKAKDLLRKIMARVREKVSEKPKWITEAVWAQLLAMWGDDRYITNRCVTSSNRDSDVRGSLHTQGSKNQLKHELELNKRLGRIPHKGELFKKCHTRKGSQTFVDKRSTDAYKNFVNLCSQAESQPHPSEAGNNESGTQPKPIDYDTLMIEAVGGRNAKGRVYGLGLDGSMRTRGSTSKSNKYSNYTDIAHGMSGEVEARLRQKIAEQQQTINSIMARQNKMIAAFSKNANIDLDSMDLDEDDHSVDNATCGSNANVGADVEE